MQLETERTLTTEIERIRSDVGAEAVAVSVHDYQTGFDFSYRADEWFHAASTIQIPLLIGVLAAVEAGRVDLESRIHVRNRFISVADGSAYRVESVRDGGNAVHAQIGKTMRLRDLARQMI